MASGPISSWQIHGEKVETVISFSWAPKSMADGDCSHGIEIHLLLGRKAMTNLASVLKSRDITLLKNVCTVKAMFFHYSCMDVRRQRAKELMLFNCGAGEDS